MLGKVNTTCTSDLSLSKVFINAKFTQRLSLFVETTFPSGKALYKQGGVYFPVKPLCRCMIKTPFAICVHININLHKGEWLVTNNSIFKGLIQ